jgi:hypothetical protein
VYTVVLQSSFLYSFSFLYAAIPNAFFVILFLSFIPYLLSVPSVDLAACLLKLQMLLSDLLGR